MHVYYKFGLFLIFILSVSTCYTRAAPTTTQSSTYDDDYPDVYDDYYDGNEANASVSTEMNRLTSMTAPTATATTDTTTSSTPLLNTIDLPKRSNHVLEPNCPKACLCLEDYKYIQCSNARLTQVPHDLPITALIVDLSHNHIKQLQADDFANCSKVRELNLSDNELTQLDRQTFEGLRRLQRLRLASNRLTHIDTDTFSSATDLNVLDLSNNSIDLPSEGSFLNQPGLLELSCRNCSWTTLYDETFANLSSLTALKLDQNDFNRKINTKAFTPLRNLIKLKLPELDQPSVQELCNLLKSIDNISFRHFDISCYELVLGTSFNESLILVTDPPYEPPSIEQANITATDDVTAHHQSSSNMTESDAASSNLTLPHDTVLTAGVLNTKAPPADNDESYQVPVSQETINIMLISIMVIAIIGLIIGFICRKDVGGIKTKCCRTRKPEPKDQVHPAEEIPLNKLA